MYICIYIYVYMYIYIYIALGRRITVSLIPHSEQTWRTVGRVIFWKTTTKAVMSS